LITLAIISIVSTFAVINIHNSRHSLRLQNSVRQLAVTWKRPVWILFVATPDAVPSSVVFTSPTSYDVTMDFAGSGTPTTRTFAFENGVEIFSNGLPSVSFNWRGRTSRLHESFRREE
jgi:hypothetical protein